MATFPPTVAAPGSQPGAGAAAPAQAGGAGGAGGQAIKLAMLSQAIQGLAKDFPQGQQAIQLMMQGLRQLQGIASTQSSPQQPAAPPL